MCRATLAGDGPNLDLAGLNPPLPPSLSFCLKFYKMLTRTWATYDEYVQVCLLMNAAWAALCGNANDARQALVGWEFTETESNDISAFFDRDGYGMTFHLGRLNDLLLVSVITCHGESLFSAYYRVAKSDDGSVTRTIEERHTVTAAAYGHPDAALRAIADVLCHDALVDTMFVTVDGRVVKRPSTLRR